MCSNMHVLGMRRLCHIFSSYFVGRFTIRYVHICRQKFVYICHLLKKTETKVIDQCSTLKVLCLIFDRIPIEKIMMIHCFDFCSRIVYAVWCKKCSQKMYIFWLEMMNSSGKNVCTFCTSRYINLHIHVDIDLYSKIDFAIDSEVALSTLRGGLKLAVNEHEGLRANTIRAWYRYAIN